MITNKAITLTNYPTLNILKETHYQRRDFTSLLPDTSEVRFL
jgi:hypothetical protein